MRSNSNTQVEIRRAMKESNPLSEVWRLRCTLYYDPRPDFHIRFITVRPMNQQLKLQTHGLAGAWPRVRGSNSSQPLDRRPATPVASRGMYNFKCRSLKFIQKYYHQVLCRCLILVVNGNTPFIMLIKIG